MMKQAICLMSLLLLASGCTKVEWDRRVDMDPCVVTLFAANGQVIKQWNSTGKIHSEKDSDGFYFTDAKTGRTVQVSGTVLVERVAK